MRIPAEKFLKLRAIGAPAVVVSLAIQGIFRGFKDTKTPVLCLGKCSAYLLKLTCRKEYECHWTALVFYAMSMCHCSNINPYITKNSHFILAFF